MKKKYLIGGVYCVCLKIALCLSDSVWSEGWLVVPGVTGRVLTGVDLRTNKSECRTGTDQRSTCPVRRDVPPVVPSPVPGGTLRTRTVVGSGVLNGPRRGRGGRGTRGHKGHEDVKSGSVVTRKSRGVLEILLRRPGHCHPSKDLFRPFPPHLTQVHLRAHNTQEDIIESFFCNLRPILFTSNKT